MKLFLRTLESFTRLKSRYVYIGDDCLEIDLENLEATRKEFDELMNQNIVDQAIKEGKNPYLGGRFGDRFTEEDFVEMTPEQYALYEERVGLEAEMKRMTDEAYEVMNKMCRFADENKLTFELSGQTYNGRSGNWESSYE